MLVTLNTQPTGRVVQERGSITEVGHCDEVRCTCGLAQPLFYNRKLIVPAVMKLQRL